MDTPYKICIIHTDGSPITKVYGGWRKENVANLQWVVIALMTRLNTVQELAIKAVGYRIAILNEGREGNNNSVGKSKISYTSDEAAVCKF